MKVEDENHFLLHFSAYNNLMNEFDEKFVEESVPHSSDLTSDNINSIA